MPPVARIGIDLGGTKTEVVLLSADGTVAWRRRVPTPRSYVDTVTRIVDLVAEVDRVDVLNSTSLSPVGIGTPGAWVPATRTMKNCNSTWLNGKPLLDDLNAALDDRVRIANDANCFALSEALDGAGKGARVVFGVILGTGVGGGIVIDGTVLAGANAIAGEWGHTPLPYFRADTALEESLAHRPCYCGRADCVETFLSGPGLAEIHRELTGEQLAAEEIPHRSPTLDLYTTMLARALAQIVNILDPDVVVLGGGVSNIPEIASDVATKLPAYGFSHEGSTAVTVAEFGDSSGVLGACRLWPGA